MTVNLVRRLCYVIMLAIFLLGGNVAQTQAAQQVQITEKTPFELVKQANQFMVSVRSAGIYGNFSTPYMDNRFANGQTNYLDAYVSEFASGGVPIYVLFHVNKTGAVSTLGVLSYGYDSDTGINMASVMVALGVAIGMTPEQVTTLTTSAIETAPNVRDSMIWCAAANRRFAFKQEIDVSGRTPTIMLLLGAFDS